VVVVAVVERSSEMKGLDVASSARNILGHVGTRAVLMPDARDPTPALGSKSAVFIFILTLIAFVTESELTQVSLTIWRSLVTG
jgi:hypothetical protein